MTTPCPSPLTRSMYADSELPAAETAALEAHLDTCAECRARVAVLKSERAMLRELLTALEPATVPAFQRPLGLRGLAIAVATVVVLGSVASKVWGALGAALPSGLRWLSPLDPGSLWDFGVSFVWFLTHEGIPMLTSIFQLTAAAVLIVLCAWGVASVLKPRAGTAALLSVLLAVCALPRLGHAFEIRKSDGVTTVPAGETVDDTLLATGDTVEIDGDVTGDLFAFGRRVTVRGNVSGNVISAGETVEIQGTVGGSVFGAGRAVTLSMRVARNLYAAARDVTIDREAEVGGDALAGAATINVDGMVAKDLTGGGGDIVLRGHVDRNMTAWANKVTLLAPAVVGGSLKARVGAEANLDIQQGATVRGAVDRQVDTQLAEREQPTNKYFTVGFYVWQVVRLGMAFVAGLLLLWLFPALQTLSLASAGAAVRAAGIGLIAVVVAPVVAVIACITVVGIPLAVIGLIAWALGLYFAKVIVAQYIGRSLFRSPTGATPHFAATLLAGLFIVLIAVNLPWIGWLAGVLLTLVGLGMLVAYLYERAAPRLA